MEKVGVRQDEGETPLFLLPCQIFGLAGNPGAPHRVSDFLGYKLFPARGENYKEFCN
jgi:hypothetical protein